MEVSSGEMQNTHEGRSKELATQSTTAFLLQYSRLADTFHPKRPMVSSDTC